MKSTINKICFGLCALLLGSPAFAESKFYAEAGVAYVALRGASYETGATPSLTLANTVPGTPLPTSTFAILGEDKSTWAPFVSAGYHFSEHIGVRLGYHYVGNLNASVKSTLLVGGDVVLGDVSLRFNDEVHVLSFAPELRWPIADKLRLTFSPELNWVTSRGEILATTSNPVINIVPRRARNEQELTFGASVGALWSLSDKCDLSLSYKYSDLKPSWGRAAHMLSGALRWNF